jgi:hypothetical protein
MLTNIDRNERTKSQGPRRKITKPVPFKKLSFETFVKECWTPHHNILGRLTGTFQPLMNFDFLDMPCADLLDFCKRDRDARQSKSTSELLRAVMTNSKNRGCGQPSERTALEAVGSVWTLYCEWRAFEEAYYAREA